MSGGSDRAGLDAGTTRSKALGDEGTAEVRTGMHVGQESGYSAIAANPNAESPSVKDRATQRAGEAADEVRDRASGMASQAKERAGEAAQQARGKVESTASQVREQAGDAMSRARGMLENGGALDPIRKNPMPALAVGFGVGFLLAGSGGGGRKGGSRVAGAAKGQLRAAVLGGVTSMIAQEGRKFLDQQGGGQGGIMGTILDALQGAQGGGSQPSRSSAGRPRYREPSHREMR